MTATVTVAAALTLSACGSGNSDGSSDGKGPGADTGARKSASPSAVESAVTDRPEIELPSDLSYTFEWPKSGDKERDAVLSDGAQSVKAVDLAIAHQDALDKPYLFYYEGEAAAGTEQFIQRYVDNKARTTGAYRFYDPKVNVRGDGTASFSYCEDQGKAFVMYLKGKRIKKTEVTADSYVAYQTSLKKNDKGVWVIHDITSQRGSAACQP
ncbi:hypothetical protein [Streptomyces dioscori]|uniref:hypothetical protein n=1 Tax=Streptomyces dioscori TaxID=2109333 RepID=UPI001CEC7996|nr:hypothetical protein [Streptomyces dioscori]